MATVAVVLLCSLSLFGNVLPVGGASTLQLPLFGDFLTLFQYYTVVQVGTPPVSFTVTIDTGSADFLIPDIDCDSCYGGNASLYYNASISTTSSKVHCDDSHLRCTACISGQCGYSMNYVGISEQAIVYKDIVTVAGKPVPAVFGAIYNVSMGDALKKQEVMMDYPEGMLGLGYGVLNSLGSTPIFDSMVESGAVQNIFSICLRPQGGEMVLGGAAPQWYSQPLMWTAITKEYFYNIHMIDLQVNGQSINISSDVYNTKNCIVDTGTPMPTLPTVAFEALRHTIESNCSQSQLVGICTGLPQKNMSLFDGICYKMTPQQRGAFPTLEFLLRPIEGSSGAVILKYTPDYYLQQQYYCDPGTYGIGVQGDSSDFGTVIGAELLQGFATVYDRQNKRIGFSPLEKCY